MRVHLAGRFCIETEHSVLDQDRFPGRQGRLVLAYLVLAHRPASRDELGDLLWPDGSAPHSAGVALNAVMSKLRGALRAAGDTPSTIESAHGWYELRLPPDAWVDVEAAAEALHRAESALMRSDGASAAWVAASIAYQIARRPFLPGETSAWAEQRRVQLTSTRTRAAEALATASLGKGEARLAVPLAEEILGYEPYRETAYQLLMCAHAALGNRAEALRTFERCRRLLAEELGADPSPETQALHLQILSGALAPALPGAPATTVGGA